MDRPAGVATGYVPRIGSVSIDEIVEVPTVLPFKPFATETLATLADPAKAISKVALLEAAPRERAEWN